MGSFRHRELGLLALCMQFLGCGDARLSPADNGSAFEQDGSVSPGLDGEIAQQSDAGANSGGRDAASGGQQAGDGDVDNPSEHPREACVLVRSGDGPQGTRELEVEVVAQNLEVPWGLAWLPNGDLLVTERAGRLRRISGGQLQNTPVLEVDVAKITLAEQLAGLASEGGLLGVLLHPEFSSNRLFYLYWTAREGGADAPIINRMGLFEMSANGNSATLQKLLLDDIPGGLHHQGGRMQLGPDGKLYVGVGAYDPSLAQDPEELPGKLLRMNLDGSVPSDNPVRGSFVFLTGIRNTQGYDWFDAEHLLVMDHGPTSIDPGVPEKGWDEFNVARAGQNLGWPRAVGCNAGSGVTEPVLVWQRSVPPGGAAIYRGTAIPEWQGNFIVATLGLVGSGEGEHLQRIVLDAENPYLLKKHEVYLKGEYGRLRTVAMGPDGHLYVTTSNCELRGTNPLCLNGGDKILRVVGAR